MEDTRGLEETRGPTGGDQSAPPIYPVSAECLPEPLTRTGKYTVRFARNSAELEALQKLRFSVFNLELGEGLEESFQTGRDEDRFDPVCHHLLVIENAGGTIVGTYRIQTGAMARAHGGFYSVGEFDLDHLPDDVMRNAVEVGRACVAREFRNRQVLFLLWRGLAAYMSKNEKRYLFGCCSLTSQDPVEGKHVMDYLVREGHLHPRIQVNPQPGWECYDELHPPAIPPSDEKVDLPQLFRIYLRYGAKVCGPPAIDRCFKTIDYLVVLDIQDLDPDSYALFFKK
jgi:putative hemolysin